MKNPKLYAVSLNLAFKPEESWRLALEEALEPFGAALVSFETDGGKGWHMEVIGEEKPAAAAVKSALKPFAGLKPVIAPVPDKDWLAESRKGLAPLKMGPFFVHGEHDRGKAPKNVIPLEIDAGMAFGTGRHETTSGCVKALLRLAKTNKFKKPLDIGTGTGILAFAAWHLFKVPVRAGDNDKDAVRVARENAAINGYAGTELYLGEAADRSVIAIFCFKQSDDNPSPECWRELELSPSLSLTYRFKRPQLAEWRKIDSDVRALVEKFRAPA